MKTNGIYPNLSRDNLENWISDNDYIENVKTHLQERSGKQFDNEAVILMIECWIQSKHTTIYEHAVKKGLISLLSI